MLSRARAMGATLRRRNYSLAVGSYSGFAVAGKEKAARVPTGGKFAVTPPMPLRDDRRPAARYQIADVVARMVAGRRPTIGAIKSDRAKEKAPYSTRQITSSALLCSAHRFRNSDYFVIPLLPLRQISRDEESIRLRVAVFPWFPSN